MEQPVQDYVEQFHFGLVEVKETKGRKAKVFNVYFLVPKKVESWADFWNQNKWTIILTAFITAFIQDKDRRIGRRIFPENFQVVYKWARGTSFSEIAQMTEVQEHIFFPKCFSGVMI